MLADRKIYYREWVFYTHLVTIKPLLISQKFIFVDTLLRKSTEQFSKVIPLANLLLAITMLTPS